MSLVCIEADCIRIITSTSCTSGVTFCKASSSNLNIMLGGNSHYPISKLNTCFINATIWGNIWVAAAQNYYRPRVQEPEPMPSKNPWKMRRQRLNSWFTQPPYQKERKNKKRHRFQMISCVFPRGLQLRRGMCNSISPTVLHQREADKSISWRHPGCVHWVYAR